MRPADVVPWDPLIREARELLALGHAAEALGACRRATRALADTAADPAQPRVRDACAILRLEARAHATAGDLDAALDALTAAAAMAAAIDDAAELGSTLNNLAIVHLQRGDLDTAESLYADASVQVERSGARPLAVQIALNRGIIANIRGDLVAAEAHYTDALGAARRAGMQSELAAALNNLGLLLADLGRWDEAERSYSECADISSAAGDWSTLTSAHVNLAEVWAGRGDYGRAREACDRALATALRADGSAVRGEVHRQLGVVAREQGELGEADAEFAEAALVAETRGDLLLLAETTREQAELYRRQGRNRDTLHALNRSHGLFTRLRARRDLADLGRRMGRLEDEFLAVARRWGESIEAADRYTQGHCQRVADLACLIAERAGPAHGFDAQTMFWYRIGALLHDVGKLEVPSEVLNKPGKLTDAEWTLMRGHAAAGVALLGDLEFPWDVRPIVFSHHERWDGRGYPHGLAGEAIPLSARVLAVADVYDALTSERSYKRAMTHDEAATILARDAGTAFDPQVIAWFDAVAPVWLAQRGADVAGRAAADGPGPVDVHAQRRAAGLDELTGLPGRAAFRDECARVLGAGANGGRTAAILLVAVEPASGALTVSDAALAVVAEAIGLNTRASDFVARQGALEFVVLLPDATADEAQATARRLVEAVRAALRAGLEFALPVVAITVGVAPEHGTTADALLAAERRPLVGV